MGEHHTADDQPRDRPDDRPTTGRRLTVREAADELGITVEAVRGRIKRHTLDSERAPDGTVYVWLTSGAHDQPATGPDQGNDQPTGRPIDQPYNRTQPDARLVEEMAARIEDLRDQLAEEREARRRADTIIAQLARANEEQARTIRELEPVADHSAPSEAPGARESAGEQTSQGPAHQQPQTAAQRRPWWRRVFGG